MVPDLAPKVMVVDDEEMVATALRSFLELETPYDVVTFTSPREALDFITHDRLHVVIADFMMPEMDGITFLKAVRARNPQTTRILLTGYADKANAIRAINEAGLYYYLEKPWDNEHLKLVVRNGVERSSLYTELDARISALEASNRQLNEIRRRLAQAFL
ncbi:MAG: response regulator [Gemmatimonadota bacterium]|jgi:DNA-binding NtrC family response regulator